MIDEEYIYQSVSVHLCEKDMLDEKDVEDLAAAAGVEEVYSILGEKGWAVAGLSAAAADADRLLVEQENMAWEFVESLLGDLTPLDVLRCANDYHNLKAAVKLAYSDDDADPGRCFLKGVADAADILEAAKAHDFSALPPDMAEAGKQAYETLAHTGNGQLSDMIIDKAALIAIDKAGGETKSSLMKEYAKLTVDGANIKAAVRCCNMGKPRDFTEQAIAPAGTLDTEALVKAAAEDLESIYEYLSYTEYSGAADVLRQGIAAFERWCENRIIAAIRPQREEFFSIDPMAAYILARLSEIRTVKLIMAAKANALDMSVISERLCETYV